MSALLKKCIHGYMENKDCSLCLRNSICCDSTVSGKEGIIYCNKCNKVCSTSEDSYRDIVENDLTKEDMRKNIFSLEKQIKELESVIVRLKEGRKA